MEVVACARYAFSEVVEARRPVVVWVFATEKGFGGEPDPLSVTMGATWSHPPTSRGDVRKAISQNVGRGLRAPLWFDGVPDAMQPQRFVAAVR